MLGYITKEEAIAQGFTHKASYYGVPCYYADHTDEYGCQGAMIQPIHHFLEPVFDMFVFIEQTIRPLMFPEDEPGFQFQLKGRL